MLFSSHLCFIFNLSFKSCFVIVNCLYFKVLVYPEIITICPHKASDMSNIRILMLFVPE